MRTLAIIIGLFLTACEIPQDPGRTLKHLQQAAPLKVGIVVAPGFAEEIQGTFSGTEVALVLNYAESIGTRIEFKKFSVEEGFKALEKKKIHLLIGGFHKSIPFKKVGFTRAYNRQKNVMGILRGENAFLVDLEKFLKKASL